MFQYKSDLLWDSISLYHHDLFMNLGEKWCWAARMTKRKDVWFACLRVVDVADDFMKDEVRICGSLRDAQQALEAICISHLVFLRERSIRDTEYLTKPAPRK